MNSAECVRLESYLCKLLGAPTLSVRPSGDGEAELLVAGNVVAGATKDEEDGELSYFISIETPRGPGLKKAAPLDANERTRLQGVLSQLLHAPALEVRPRPRKTDSAEVYVGAEFVGTVSADEDAGYYFTMIVLGLDLDDV